MILFKSGNAEHWPPEISLCLSAIRSIRSSDLGYDKVLEWTFTSAQIYLLTYCIHLCKIHYLKT